jgi:plasmid maintenance system antidote protein VapI
METTTALDTRYIATGLRDTLNEQGRKITWLAARIGVSHAFISLIADGHRSVSAEHAEQITMVLDVPIESIFTPASNLSV